MPGRTISNWLVREPSTTYEKKIDSESEPNVRSWTCARNYSKLY